jgi:hypothetical protein
MKSVYQSHLNVMKRCLTILFFFSGVIHAFGQIHGVILDNLQSKPIEGAWVVLDNGRSAFTDSQGEFVIQDNRGMNDRLQVEVIMVGYVSWSYVGQRKDFPLSISLQENVRNLPALEIVEGPAVVFGSEQWNVGDFTWDKNGDLLLLVYAAEERWKRQEDAKRTLFNGAGVLRVVRDSSQKHQQYRLYPIPELAECFYDQFPGEVIVKGYNRHFMLRNDQLYFVPDSIMKRQIEPVVDTLSKEEFVMTDFQSTYPAFDYYLASDKGWQSLHHIEDEKEMELFRSEYKYLGPKEKVEAYQFQLDTGIDKEIIAAYMRGFPNSNYHSPIYAPLMVLGDTVLILDHLHSKGLRFLKNGTPLDQFPIHYHQLKGKGKWMGKVWKDPNTHSLYTAYSKNGRVTILLILQESNAQKELQTLEHSYVERIRIRGNQIFYIYRPFESSQKRYLYSEKIKS